tara:strand:+ start:22194 stop:23873 length:1680 start_codon:yes stop_codon:yes gene_type:complete
MHRDRVLAAACTVVAFFGAFIAVRNMLHAAPASEPLSRSSVPSERTEPSTDPEEPQHVAAQSPSTERSTSSSVVVGEHAVAPVSMAGAPAPVLVVQGLVSLEDGSPLEGASVWVLHLDGERTRVTTDSMGRYAISGIPVGSNSLHAGLRDHHTTSAEVVVTRDEPVVRQDFILRSKQVVWVRLVGSDGEAVLSELSAIGMHIYTSQLLPVATRLEPGDTFSGIHGSPNNTNGIGSFGGGPFLETAKGPEYMGPVTLHEDGPAWMCLVAAGQVLRKQAIDPTVQEVTFVVDPSDVFELRCTVRARLVSAITLEPVAGMAWLSDDPFQGGRGTKIQDDGLVEFVDVWPGTRFLVVHAEGFTRDPQELLIGPGEVLDLGQLLMHEPVTISGWVVDAEGRGVKSTLRWGTRDPGGGDIEWVRQRSQQSADDGSFTLYRLVPGDYVVQVLGSTRRGLKQDGSFKSHALRVDATAGSVEGVELVVADTRRVVLVTEDMQEPWPIARIVDDEGLPMDGGYLGRWSNESVLEVPDGTWNLIVEQNGVVTTRKTLVVDGEPLRIELDG